MAQKFLSDINPTAGLKDSSGDLGSDGQVLSSTGAGTNWVQAGSGATVIYDDQFIATANQTVFTLSNTVDAENKTQVYIDGAYQAKAGYTVSGTTLTFDTGLDLSSKVEVITFATAIASNATAVIKLDEFVPGDAISNTSGRHFTLSQIVSDEKVTQVYINGVYQHKDTYSISGTTLQFSSAPPSGSDIEVITFDTVVAADGTLSATTFLGDLNGTINTATTATTQSAGNNSTLVATTEFATTALNLKSNIASPTFTGTVGGITKAMVGLTNAEDTTDLLKPVSTATQSALNLKANLSGPTFTGNTSAANLTLTGYLNAPASFTIDPATHGDITGTVVIAGNLQVDGTTTTINSTTVSIDDLNFSIATDAADSAAANGAGITIGGAGASLTYSHSGTKFVLNKPLDVTGAGTFSGNITVGDSHFIGDDGYSNLLLQSSSGENINISSANDVIFYTGGTSPSSLGTQGLRIFNSSGNATFSGVINIPVGAEATPSLIFAGDSDSGMWHPTANTLAFSTFGNERMRITSGGDVTIGSATYGADLGQLRIINDAASSPASLSLFGYNNVAAGANYASIDLAMQSSGTGGDVVASIRGLAEGTGENASSLAFYTATGGTLAERMLITNEGVLRVGTITGITPALLSVRKNGTCIEYGHGNNNGRYEGTLGAFGSSGHPYIGFSTSCDNSTNTFTTRGWKGNVINSDDQGDLIFSQATNANAGSQTLTQRMRISSAGNVGIGMAPSTDAKLEILNGNIRVRGSSANSIMLSTTAGATRAALGNYGNEGDLSLWRSNNAKYIYLSSYYDSYINPDGGSLFIGGTANLGYNSHNVVKNGSQSYALIVRNSNTTTTNNSSIQLNVAAAGVDGYFMICRQGDPNSGTNRLWINTNGDVKNVNNSYGAISDERKKENIVDATPKLDKLMEVKVRNFNLIGEETKQIGVVAQELEEVFPGMISESKDPDSEDETLYKSVKYSVFVPMLIKAIQEQQTIIEDLKSRIETLEG